MSIYKHDRYQPPAPPVVHRCKRCHGILTDKDSIARGYGEKCWEVHVKEEMEKKLYYCNMRQMDLI